MITVSLVGDKTLHIEASPRETQRLKEIPGTRYLKQQNVWSLPLGLTALAHLYNYPTGIEYRPDALAALQKLCDFGEDQDEARENEAPLKGQDDSLYPFQRAGVRFIGKGKRVLLADEMGTGKTVQTLVALDLANAYPMLVVCPNSLKHNWAKEVGEWTDAMPYVVEGTAAQRRKTMGEAVLEGGDKVVVIINYESLVKHTAEAPFGNTVLSDKDKEPGELNDIQWSSVVVDEAHRIKSPKAHSTRSVWGVSRNAPYRVALTGTPVVNNPDDLWSIMHFLDPEGWPSRNRFRDGFCHMRVGFHGGYENLGLREDTRPKLDIMVKPRMIRRTKAEVLPQLPEKIETTRFLPMGPKQKKAYNQMVEFMMAEVEGGVLTATDPLTLLGRLRYAASAIPVVNEDGDVIELTTPSNKLDEIKAILAETSGPLVVYGESRKLMEMISYELPAQYRVGMITGAIPVVARQGFVEEFQKGNIDVMLATTGAGAEGITLTAASTLVMAQESWSNVANKQAHDRIHRIGQDRGTEIVTLMSEGTVDVAVHYATMEKEGQLQSLVQDPEWLAAAARGSASA